MQEIKNLSPVRENKIDWNKVRTQMIIGLVVIGMFYCTSLYLTEQCKIWNSQHGFQSPVIFRSPIYDKETKKDEPVSKVIVKPVEAKEIEKDWDSDLVGYFRYHGEQIGYSETDITKLHTVMDKENGLHTADRKNYLYDGENGHYSAAGFAMITTTTWKQHKCSGEKFDGTDNIDCFYKIIGKNGLKDYKASEDKWGKEIDKNTITFIKL